MTKRRNAAITALLAATVSLTVPGPSRGEETRKGRMHLLLNGGFAFIDVQDINNCIMARSPWNEAPNGYLEWDPVKRSKEIGIEVGFDPTKHASVGIGVGYSFFDNSGEFGFRDGSMTRHETWQWTSIPLFATLHYGIPIDSTSTITVHGEGGYYFGHLDGFKDVRWDYRSSGEDDYGRQEGEIDATSNALSGSVGLGVDIALRKGISLILEGSYRALTFKDIQGSERIRSYQGAGLVDSSSRQGYLWHAEYRDENGTWHHDSFFQEGPLNNPPWTSRHADYDLGGISLKMGVKYSFGSPFR